ncbi:hydroxyisourate hydrolase [Paenibacillus caui]|uniref:hydroxyisourate hydrolase n=1 Tax=Paenibacillus caui TaxID=2873927 RepID=UPI001CA91CC8|nr:hydroxyisourate hydrolase [Paenibacillus caui]
MAGKLTTHVLDISRGVPAAGMHIRLFRLDGESRQLLREADTNSDGRLDQPLLSEGALEAGLYELVFDAGGYFRESPVFGLKEEELFLEQVPIRFRVSDPKAHYHVPLLVAPGGYSTYRGS